MSRKFIDCRKFPGDCTLLIAGEEHEVVRAGIAHSVAVHGAQESDELRLQVYAAMEDER